MKGENTSYIIWIKMGKSLEFRIKMIKFTNTFKRLLYGDHNQYWYVINYDSRVNIVTGIFMMSEYPCVTPLYTSRRYNYKQPKYYIELKR